MKQRWMLLGLGLVIGASAFARADVLELSDASSLAKKKNAADNGADALAKANLQGFEFTGKNGRLYVRGRFKHQFEWTTDGPQDLSKITEGDARKFFFFELWDAQARTWNKDPFGNGLGW